MGLTQAQRSIIQKSRSVGNSDLAVPLTDDACAYLVAVIARDLGLLDQFPEFQQDFAPFFSEGHPEELVLTGIEFIKSIERLIAAVPDADTYFSCLAALHKARLKYARILECQPIPTMDQVGPRGLLQYGQMPAKALAGLLLWRKWIYDIDNRAAQETGYLFEPIIANAMGGVPVGSKKSPVKRHMDNKKGRQVDCIRNGNEAYEIKIRVTIAASGQGRWQEELDFPKDCKLSGFTPILIVFDDTPNEKLPVLMKAFTDQGGKAFVGKAAWDHLNEAAGPTMTRFLEIYVHAPIQAILKEIDGDQLPDITLSMGSSALKISVGGTTFESTRRYPNPDLATGDDRPDDIDEETPGV